VLNLKKNSFGAKGLINVLHKVIVHQVGHLPRADKESYDGYLFPFCTKTDSIRISTAVWFQQ